VWACVLGCYTVPTFAYVVASAFSWLGGQALWHRRWRLLGQAVGAGMVVAGGVVLLYAPLLLVSGPAALLANPYVRAQAPAGFWAGLPTYVWTTEGFLAGQRRLGGVLTVAGLALFAQVARRAATGQLSAAPARQVWAVGLPALWFMLLPYALLIGQRVQPPERVMLYKAWFFFMLVGLALAHWPGQAVTLRRVVLGGCLLFAASQLALLLRANYLFRQRMVGYVGVYSWLASQAPRPAVLSLDLFAWAWLRFETHIETPEQQWNIDPAARAGVRYQYVVTRRAQPRPTCADRVAYANAYFLIYTCVRPATIPQGPTQY
jgi:hypothetical protein